MKRHLLLTMICATLPALRVAAIQKTDDRPSYMNSITAAELAWQMPQQMLHTMLPSIIANSINITPLFILATVLISILTFRMVWLSKQSAMWRSAYIDELTSSCNDTAAAQIVKAAIHDEAYVVDKYDKRLLQLIGLASQSNNSLQHQLYLQTTCMSKLFRLKALHQKCANLHSRLLKHDLVRMHHACNHAFPCKHPDHLRFD